MFGSGSLFRVWCLWSGSGFRVRASPPRRPLPPPVAQFGFGGFGEM